MLNWNDNMDETYELSSLSLHLYRCMRESIRVYRERLIEIHMKSTSVFPFNARIRVQKCIRYTSPGIIRWFLLARASIPLCFSRSLSLYHSLSLFSCTEYLHFIPLIFYNLFILHIYGDKVNILSLCMHITFGCCVFLEPFHGMAWHPCVKNHFRPTTSHVNSKANRNLHMNHINIIWIFNNTNTSLSRLSNVS